VKLVTRDELNKPRMQDLHTRAATTTELAIKAIYRKIVLPSAMHCHLPPGILRQVST